MSAFWVSRQKVLVKPRNRRRSDRAPELLVIGRCGRCDGSRGGWCGDGRGWFETNSLLGKRSIHKGLLLAFRSGHHLVTHVSEQKRDFQPRCFEVVKQGGGERTIAPFAV